MSNLLDRSSIVLTPTAYDNGEVLCVKPSDGSGDFSFSRATEATRINSQGLVEVVADNLPRINYEGFSYDGSGNIISDSGCGSWLFEPQSTNLITYSEDFSTAGVWTKVQVTVLDNQAVSPDGTQNSSKVTKLGNNANDRLKEDLTITSGVSYNVSVFLKNNTIVGTTTLAARVNGGTLFRLGFDWNGETPSISGSYSSGTRTNEIIENYGNGWYRVGFSFLSDGTDVDIEIDLDRARGNDTTSLYIWGAQVEEQTYATSYIPTSGTTVTRVGETCVNATPVINSEQGVLYAEIAALADDGTNREISISDGTTGNRITIRYRPASGQIQAAVVSGGTTQAIITKIGLTTTNFAKVALKYSQNNFALWINGIEVGTDTSGLIPTGLNNLSFDIGIDGFNNFFGNTKDLQVFTEALSDYQLAQLTTI